MAQPLDAGTGPDLDREIPGEEQAEAAPELAGADSLAYAQVVLDTTERRLPGVNRSAMAMVLLLHRVANAVVYDLESTVHRPAGWSWSAFRLIFTLWVAGPQESSRVAALTGMSRAAVSSLAKTLSASGMVTRSPDLRDRRSVILSLTDTGSDALEAAFLQHNRREAQWAQVFDDEELATFNRLLGKLARAARTEEWVSHRF